jgi:CubicO group peptidase (beta-lactamase class C family)
MSTDRTFGNGNKLAKNVTNIRKILAVLLTLTLFQGCAQQELTPITAEALTEELDNIVRTTIVPGFSIAFVKAGDVLYKQGFGYQNVEFQFPYTAETQQTLGSVSKTFIGAAIAKAISLGLFSLDTPINSILSQPIFNPNFPAEGITIRNLVNHTSGILDREEAYDDTYYVTPETDQSIDPESPMGQLYTALNVKVTDDPRSLSRLVADYFYSNGALYSSTNFTSDKPGSKVQYSNLSASLAAYVVEVASGMPYELFLQTHILNPLSMHSTGFDSSTVSPSEQATFYVDSTPLPPYELESFPDGGLRSTANDLSLYLLDMMNGLTGTSDVLFDKSYYDLLFAPNGDFSIFWQTDGQGTYFHSGSDPGITTIIGFGPEFGGGFVLLMNLDAEVDGNESYVSDLWESQISPLVLRFLATDDSN